MQVVLGDSTPTNSDRLAAALGLSSDAAKLQAATEPREKVNSWCSWVAGTFERQEVGNNGTLAIPASGASPIAINPLH